MKARKGIQTGFTIAVVFWMILIFWFSSKPADESTDMSLSVGRVVGRVFVKDYQIWDEKKQEKFAEKIDFPVRKAAHATEYAVLGVLLLGTWYSYGRPVKKAAVSSVVTGALYASTDEFHQLFVPGRSGQIRDVLIDSCGLISGIVAACIVVNIIMRRKSGKTT